MELFEEGAGLVDEDEVAASGSVSSVSAEATGGGGGGGLAFEEEETEKDSLRMSSAWRLRADGKVGGLEAPNL